MPRNPKKEKKDDLDTETTFADMNVEGFRWYDPSKKKSGGKTTRPKVSRKEYWKLVRAAFAAYLPAILIMLATFGIVIVLAYLWLS